MNLTFRLHVKTPAGTLILPSLEQIERDGHVVLIFSEFGGFDVKSFRLQAVRTCDGVTAGTFIDDFPILDLRRNDNGLLRISVVLAPEDRERITTELSAQADTSQRIIHEPDIIAGVGFLRLGWRPYSTARVRKCGLSIESVAKRKFRRQKRDGALRRQPS